LPHHLRPINIQHLRTYVELQGTIHKLQCRRQRERDTKLPADLKLAALESQQHRVYRYFQIMLWKHSEWNPSSVMEEARKVDNCEESLMTNIMKVKDIKKEKVQKVDTTPIHYPSNRKKRAHRPPKKARRLAAAVAQLQNDFPQEEDFFRELQKYKDEELAKLELKRAEEHAKRAAKVQKRNAEMDVADIFGSLAIGRATVQRRQRRKQKRHCNRQRMQMHLKTEGIESSDVAAVVPATSSGSAAAYGTTRGVDVDSGYEMMEI